MADSRDRGKMVHPKHGAPAGGYQPAPAPHQTCPMDHARDDVLTPAAIERIKAEVMTLETIGGLWVSAEAAAQQPVVVGASPRGRTPGRGRLGAGAGAGGPVGAGMTGRPQPSAAPLFRAIRGGGGARIDDDFCPTPPDTEAHDQNIAERQIPLDGGISMQYI